MSDKFYLFPHDILRGEKEKNELECETDKRPDDMRICITGGAGFIGSHLVRRIREDHSLLVIDRSPDGKFPEFTVKGDIRDRDLLDEHLEGTDLVIHLAAEHADNVHPPSRYYEVNVEGTRNVLEAMGRHDIKHIIFTSTAAVYGLENDNADENQPPDPFNDYGESKLQAERLMKAWQQRGDGRAASVLRPTVVFGEENRGNVYNLLRQIVSGRFLMVGDGQNRKSMAYVGNLVSFIDYLIGHPDGFRIFNYADKPDLTTREIIRTTASTLDVEIPGLRIPYWLGLAGGFALDALSKVTGKQFPISAVRVKKFCATTRFDAGKVRRNGFSPPYSLEEGLRRTLQYEFKEQRP